VKFCKANLLVQSVITEVVHCAQRLWSVSKSFIIIEILY